jgi:hypothetical protein
MFDEGIGQRHASLPEGGNIGACDRFHFAVSVLLPAGRIGHVHEIIPRARMGTNQELLLRLRSSSQAG